MAVNEILESEETRQRRSLYRAISENVQVAVTVFFIVCVIAFTFMMGVVVAELNETQKDLQELKDKYELNTLIRVKQKSKK